jgi:hypothetical protein
VSEAFFATTAASAAAFSAAAFVIASAATLSAAAFAAAASFVAWHDESHFGATGVVSTIGVLGVVAATAGVVTLTAAESDPEPALFFATTVTEYVVDAVNPVTRIGDTAGVVVTVMGVPPEEGVSVVM